MRSARRSSARSSTRSSRREDAELLEQPGQQNGGNGRSRYEHESLAGADAIAGAAVGGELVAHGWHAWRGAQP